MSTRFVPNPDFRRELRAESQYKAGMTGITVGVSESIRDAALVYRNTGAYMRDIGPVEERLADGEHRIALPRHIWHVVELGSVNNPPQANVLRGVRAAGLRYEHDAAAATEALETAEARRADRRR